MRNVSLIPYLCGAGGSTPGCERAYADLKARGLTDALKAGGIQAAWADMPPLDVGAYRHLPALGTEERKQIVLTQCAALRDAVNVTVTAGRYPVAIGGDHSMGAGSIAGLAKALNAQGRIGVIWIDAHADINTPDTSPSQALHGMPVAALMGQGDPDFVALTGGKPVLRPEHVFYLGLRDVDPGEWAAIEQAGIGYLTMEALRRDGIQQGFAKALEMVSRGTDHIIVSLDIDAFNPSEAPAVGTPVPGGFTREEMFPALGWLIREAKPAMLEIAEYNPTLPGIDQTYGLMLDILKTMLTA